MKNKYKNRGFTLLELLVVVAIVGILAAVGYPSYRQYILRAHRTEGLGALQQIATRQERFFSDNSAYAPTVAALGESATTENGYFVITVGAGACGDVSRCYTLTAAAQGAQADDTVCAAMTLDSSGNKLPAACW